MSNVYLYMYIVHLQMFYTGQVLLWAVCYIGRVLLWGGHGLGQHYKQQPGKELARGQFARQGACVGEGEGRWGIFFGPEMFLKMLEGSLEMFSLLVFQLQCNTSDFEWKLNFTFSLTMI